MKIDVSIGEVFDKITILQIKLEKIKDHEKLKHIEYESMRLFGTLRTSFATRKRKKNLTQNL